jgi:hypothetical protein
MAVKFSQFTPETVAANVTEIVGYTATGDLNVRIPPANLDTLVTSDTAQVGTSATYTLSGTKTGTSTTTDLTTYTVPANSGMALTAGTNTIAFDATSYSLASTDSVVGNNSVPVNLTGTGGGDSGVDTVTIVGTGTVQVSSATNTITIDGGSTGDVTSFTNSNGGSFVAYGTVNTAATGPVTIGDVDLTASGTASATTFLRGDNQWATPIDTDTTYDLETTTVANGQTNVPVTLASAAGDDTLNLLGAGTVTIGSDSGTGLITITGGGVGDVTSINTATSGVSSTANPITLTGTAGAGPFTGAITVASNAYAGGADVGHVPSGGSAGEYLDGASGAWITIPAGYTSWNLTGDSGTTEAIADGNTVDVAGGTDITTVASSADTLTVNHDAITRTDTTSTDAPAAGASVDLVKTISTSAQGHVTAIDVSTVTWPAAGGGFGSINQTTGTGSSLGAITLGSTPAAAFNCLISISGVTQNYLDAAGTPNWTVSTNTLTFAFNPPVTATNGIQIIVIA